MSANDGLVCYNRGCGKRYTDEENLDDACQHHPGSPVFHDAYKGWSCCKKKTTDFTEFLNIPGCTKGKHSNVKPEEPVKNVEKPLEVGQVIKEEVPIVKHAPPTRTVQRPRDDLPKVRLRSIIGASLKTALKKYQEKQKQQQNEAMNGEDDGDDVVKVGTPCKNNGCNERYIDESSNEKSCVFHPGYPVFHEGYKFWTCCQKRTSDFDEFLKQYGCETGQHRWMKPSEAAEKRSTCRYDWHQTGSFVYISIYAKVTDPEKTYIEANQTSANIHVAFNGGIDIFELCLTLYEPVDPAQSMVELLGTKVEIKLKKQDGFRWKKLEYTPMENENDSNSNSATADTS